MLRQQSFPSFVGLKMAYFSSNRSIFCKKKPFPPRYNSIELKLSLKIDDDDEVGLLNEAFHCNIH